MDISAHFLGLINSFFDKNHIASAVFILSLVTALGLAIGNIKVYGVSLGVAGVLFAGIILGHLGFEIDKEILEFARDFGLILFVYTIGIQVGPGFVASLRKEGLKLNLLATAIVVLGVVMTLVVHFVGLVDLNSAVGLYSGGVTNTPSLGAATQTLADLGASETAIKTPGLGYAIAYPFGVVGIILAMSIIRVLFRVNLKSEVETLNTIHSNDAPKLQAVNLQVTNPNLDGMELRNVPGLNHSGIVISRIMDDDVVSVAEATSVLKTGNVLLAVGPPEKIEEMKIVIGGESQVDLRHVAQHLRTRRIVVSKGAALNKSIKELSLPTRFNCQVTRANRMEVELPVTADFKLQFADVLTVVGEDKDLERVSKELGNSLTKLNHPQLLSVFLGIALGVIVGNVGIPLPGMPVPVKLGMAGGPLIVAILLSRIGQIGRMSCYMPISANFMLRQVGIGLFLACVGLKAGDSFWQTLSKGDGFVWMGWGALITIVPLLIVGIFARLAMKVNFVAICGLLAGSMTDPPALAFSTTMTGSDLPNISYAAVYPLVMILRVLTAQALILAFMH